jgi:hypothetical protein
VYAGDEASIYFRVRRRGVFVFYGTSIIVTWWISGWRWRCRCCEEKLRAVLVDGDGVGKVLMDW